MTLLYAGPPAQIPIWKKELYKAGPDVPLRFWPDYGKAEDIRVVLVARDIPGDLSIFPNLAAIQTLWAGVDKLLSDPRLPRHLPLARMADPGLARGMGEFILYHSLDYLRSGPALRAAQRQAKWQVPPLKLSKDVTIGIMGLGEMGRQSLDYLRPIGFKLYGWAASEKRIDGVECFAGQENLGAFLQRCDVIACLLPLTASTTNILSQKLFDAMRKDSWLIHAGRGDHLDETALLAALANNQPAHAVLDVFREEPLPAHHPFWNHPQITISPHAAAVTPPGAGASLIIENYRRATSGRELLHLVDRQRQY